MNVWMKRMGAILAAALLVGLVACGGAAATGEVEATDTPIAGATAATPATPVATTALINTPEAPPVAADILLGPVIGFNLENSYEEYYLALFDVGTNTFREFPNTAALVMPYAARWFDGGCAIYADGRLLNLQGEVIWSAPDEVLAQTVDWHNSFLSPDRAWVATVIDAGAGERHIETIRLSPPFDRVRLTERGGGHPGAVLWSADDDGLWLLFSDDDAGGVRQVFRAHPDGTDREQLTAHETSPALIVALALSPDGRRLAYGVRNLAVPSQPYTYRAEDEGWIGIIDRATGESHRVALPRLLSVELGQGPVGVLPAFVGFAGEAMCRR